MVTIQIGDGPVMKQSEIREGWVNQQISRRKQEWQSVCVKITISSSTVDMLLATPGCAGTGSSRHVPPLEEKRILDLWVAQGLNSTNFTGGSVVAFLHQLERAL